MKKKVIIIVSVVVLVPLFLFGSWRTAIYIDGKKSSSKVASYIEKQGYSDDVLKKTEVQDWKNGVFLVNIVYKKEPEHTYTYRIENFDKNRKIEINTFYDGTLVYVAHEDNYYFSNSLPDDVKTQYKYIKHNEF